jgi:DNA excision repair protein ERCC-2
MYAAQVCIEALSVTLDNKVVEGAVRNLNLLDNEVKRMKTADASRLQEEYARLVSVRLPVCVNV